MPNEVIGNNLPSRVVDLTDQYTNCVDETFVKHSDLTLISNQDMSWDGAHSVRVYKVTTSPMSDYDRSGTESRASRYGHIDGLDATTEIMTLKNDRSFTFAIDKLDRDETQQAMQASTALARQLAQVVFPEVERYLYNVVAEGAGNKPAPKALTEENIYDEIIEANSILDDAQVPGKNRVLIVPPKVYVLLKKSTDIMMSTDIAQEKRDKGVISMLDGCQVIKVPENQLPKNFGFMITHPIATVAPLKLRDYKIHADPPGISGDLVEGRVCYDAFVLDNKASAIYYQEQPDLSLDALAIGSLTLSPAFDGDKTSYTAATTDSTNTITATAEYSGATVSIKNGSTAVTSGSAATWVAGENTVSITVSEGKRSKVYEVVVTKS